MSTPNYYEKSLKQLFSDLIWPAVAGNVAWAFFTVMVQGNHSLHYGSRLVALGLIAVYLMIAWRRGEQKTKHPGLYKFLDGLFAVAIAIFANALQAEALLDPYISKWVDYSLGAVFFVVLIGHFWVWNSERCGCLRLIMIAANFVACLIAATRKYFFENSLIPLPVAVGIVLVAWSIVAYLERGASSWNCQNKC